MLNMNFSDYHLSGELLKAISMLNYRKPTRVQQEVIPAVLAHRDIIVKSQTGSGKTAAFAIPICHLADWNENKPQALVLTPTRELALQVKEDIFNIGRFKRIKVPAVFGKASFYLQEKELKQKSHVVVGTPGRIIDHLERGTFDTSNIKYLVIDEADEMLNMGFIEQIEKIISSLPEGRTTILLSATMPSGIQELCGKYIKSPVFVEIEEENKTADRIIQERYEVEQRDKLKLLRDLAIVENPDSCMIFCNTKLKVDEVYEQLEKHKYTCGKIHGDMEQRDRLRVMTDFKTGRFRYLVATDIAARGIDVDDISLVINFDIPQDSENYVHRIGRTGRAHKSGKAISFVSKNESKFLDAIHRYTGKEIPLCQKPEEAEVLSRQQKFDEKLQAVPEVRETKGAQLGREIMKLHINAGKKTKMRPADVVGTLCNIKGMTAEDIGIISVEDISTYVEILNDKGEMVYRRLQDTPIKGRLRKVSKVERGNL